MISLYFFFWTWAETCLPRSVQAPFAREEKARWSRLSESASTYFPIRPGSSEPGLFSWAADIETWWYSGSVETNRTPFWRRLNALGVACCDPEALLLNGRQ
jgi:hypothetical protein